MILKGGTLQVNQYVRPASKRPPRFIKQKLLNVNLLVNTQLLEIILRELIFPLLDLLSSKLLSFQNLQKYPLRIVNLMMQNLMLRCTQAIA